MKGRTVFKLAPNPDGSWTMTKLHVFGRGLLTPLAGLVMDAAGNLYGTGVGGRKGDGVVFKITP
jgi:hypothetical protein